MSNYSKITKKLPVIFLGIFLGLGTTYLFDKYRENQSEEYIFNVMLVMKDFTNDSNKNISDSNFFKTLDPTTISRLKNLGILLNYSILSTDSALDFSNAKGLHTVAIVKTSATYVTGITQFTFSIYKKNGLWNISGINIHSGPNVS